MKKGLPIDFSMNKELDFIPDIQEIMFGLGDCPKPLEKTARVIEEIVLEQLNAIICQAEELSSRRGATVISPQDLLFLLRHDKIKLQRLINYLALKDQKSIFQNNGLSFTTNGEIDEENAAYPMSTQSNRSQICVSYLKDLGIDISIDPSKQIFDGVKMRRQLRAEWMSRTLPSKQYTEFTKCRQTSFHGKFRKTQKFLDWISVKHGENVGPKLKVSTYDILVYLAKETIAELLDLVFLLRRDKMSSPSDPFSRAHYVSIQPTSRQEMLDPNSKIECVTPEEIQEVVRRYWSNQLCPLAVFSRKFSRITSNRLMSCA